MNIFDDRDLYASDYINFRELNYTNVNSTIIDPVQFAASSTFLRGSLTLLLRLGFIFIQIGSIPTSNVYFLILYNFIDMTFATITYAFIGFIISFGDNYHRYVGRADWIMTKNIDMDQVALGWCATVITNALITTCFAGRMHVTAFISTTMIISSFTHPIYLHWAWTEHGFMRNAILFDRILTLHDYAGSLVIHTVGGYCGFLGIVFLGRRILRLSEISENSLGPDSPGLCIAGYFLILVGLMSMNLPMRRPLSTNIDLFRDVIGYAILNNILAAVGGMLTVICIHYIIYGDSFTFWNILWCFQGAIAGVVTISAGANVYRPLIALGLSIIGGILFYIYARQTYFSAFEDYCNIAAAHLACGVLGILLPPLFGTSSNLGLFTIGHTAFIYFGWQLACLALVLLTLTVICGVLFGLLLGSNFILNKTEKRNKNRAERIKSIIGKRCCLQRIFTPNSDSKVILPGYESKRLLINFENENYDSSQFNNNYFLFKQSKDPYSSKSLAGSRQGGGSGDLRTNNQRKNSLINDLRYTKDSISLNTKKRQKIQFQSFYRNISVKTKQLNRYKFRPAKKFEWGIIKVEKAANDENLVEISIHKEPQMEKKNEGNTENNKQINSQLSQSEVCNSTSSPEWNSRYEFTEHINNTKLLKQLKDDNIDINLQDLRRIFKKSLSESHFKVNNYFIRRNSESNLNREFSQLKLSYLTRPGVCKRTKLHPLKRIKRNMNFKNALAIDISCYRGLNTNEKVFKKERTLMNEDIIVIKNPPIDVTRSLRLLSSEVF